MQGSVTLKPQLIKHRIYVQLNEDPERSRNELRLLNGTKALFRWSRNHIVGFNLYAILLFRFEDLKCDDMKADELLQLTYEILLCNHRKDLKTNKYSRSYN